MSDDQPVRDESDAGEGAGTGEATAETAPVSEQERSETPAMDPGAEVSAELGDAPAQPTNDSKSFDLPDLQSQGAQGSPGDHLDLLSDVDLNVKIELGRTRMLVEDVLKLGRGSVVELDKLAGDPVDIYVNERLVARGEVLVLNDNFCVRVNELVSGKQAEVRRKSA